jgi:hypothetical protein
MSQHKVKQAHAVAERLRELARIEFIASVKKSSFLQRLKFCMSILFK